MSDSEQPHLKLRVTPQGRKCWYFHKSRRARKDGTPGEAITLKLGEWPADLNVDQARDVVSRMLTAAKMGMHPQRFRRQLVWQASTFRDVFNEYLEKHLKVFAAPRTVEESQRAVNNHCSKFLDMPVRQLTSLDLQEWLNDLASTHSTGTANRYYTILVACLRWADTHGLIEFKHCPTAGVRKFREENRERYLNRAEYERLERALHKAANQNHADAIRLLLYTGARKSNVLAMKWSELDLSSPDTATWTIPSSKSKSRKTITLPLTTPAIEVLLRRQMDYGYSPFVFPANSRTGHLVNPWDLWVSVCAEADITDVRIHDLRHTVGSALGASGASAFVIQRALGHSSVTTTARYTHLDVSAVREAMEKAQDSLGIARPVIPTPAPVDSPNVIQLHPRAPIESARSKIVAAAPPKNADVRISGAEQVIVEAKILTAIRCGGDNKKAFYRKIGGCFAVNSHEMNRILASMVDRGLIRRVYTSNVNVVKYVIGNEIATQEEQA